MTDPTVGTWQAAEPPLNPRPAALFDTQHTRMGRPIPKGEQQSGMYSSLVSGTSFLFALIERAIGLYKAEVAHSLSFLTPPPPPPIWQHLCKTRHLM
jgi:hypothetical protein